MRAWKLRPHPHSLFPFFFFEIFTHFHFTLFKPFFHLFYITLFLLAVPVFTPPPLCTTFPVCVLQFSRRLLDRTELQSGGTPHLIPLTVTIHILYFEACTDLVSLILSHWNKNLHTSNRCNHVLNKMLRWCKILQKDSMHEILSRNCVVADQGRIKFTLYCMHR